MDASKREATQRRWRELIRRQGESGLSVRAFCRQEDVREPSFYAWRRKLAGREAAAKTKTPSFVPAVVEAPPPGDQPIVLELPSGGGALRLPATMALARVAELVLRLQQRGAS